MPGGRKPVIANRSVPTDIVLPHVYYHDVDEAVAWLKVVFGFSEHYRYGDQSAFSGARIHLGNAWIIVQRARGQRKPQGSGMRDAKPDRIRGKCRGTLPAREIPAQRLRKS
jgi:hypothetical protein